MGREYDGIVKMKMNERIISWEMNWVDFEYKIYLYVCIWKSWVDKLKGIWRNIKEANKKRKVFLLGMGRDGTVDRMLKFCWKGKKFERNLNCMPIKASFNDTLHVIRIFLFGNDDFWIVCYDAWQLNITLWRLPN